MKINENLITICVSYTIISIAATIINILTGHQNNNLNTISMFVLTVIAVFVLSIHRLFDGWSPLMMMIMQYIIAIGLVMLFVFVVGRFSPVSEGGYWDIFWSFTIPYAIGACIYYIHVFQTARRLDETLKEIRKMHQEKETREEFLQ